MAATDAGSIYSEVRIKLDALTADITAVNAQFDKIGTSVQAQNTKTKKSFEDLGLAGTVAIGAITLAFKSAVSTFAETEQKLANVKAVSNATAAEFAQLEEAANEAGTTTRFTAGEAADALYYLSSAGLSATESIAALDGVLELAGATGSDLATTAQAVTSSLSQFGLEADESARVANVFAAAASNSQATLDKMKASLTTVGPVAGALGIELEEVTGSLQSLYNAGFKGETAGTALKTALAFLADESSTTVTELKKLGIAFEEINPEEVGLTGALEALEDAGASTADVIAAFGTEAGPALVSLLNDGTDAIKDYTEAVTDTNEAARQYAEQNDTLAGSFDSFTSAAEGASNHMIEQLEPILSAVVDLAASLLRGVAQLPDGLTALGTGATVAAVGFVALAKGLALVGVSLSTGPLALVAVAGAAAVGLVTLAGKVKDARDRTDELTEATDLLVSTSEDYQTVTKTLSEDMDSLSESEKTLLENRQKLLALQLQEQLADIADEYAKINKQIEKGNDETEKSQGRLDALLLLTNDREAAEARLYELNKKHFETFNLTTKEAEEYTTLLEESSTREKKLLKELEDAAADLAEAEREGLETYSVREEQLTKIAQAYKDGILDIDIYAKTNEELYNKIIELAAGLETVTEVTEEESKKQKKVAEDTLKARQEFEDQWNQTLADSVASRSELIEAERTEALAAAEKLGADTAAINEYYDNQQKELDEESNAERLALEQEWADALLELKQDEFAKLEAERQKAIEEAEAAGADTAAIEEYYELKKTELLDEQITTRNALRAQEYTYVASLAGALSDLLTAAAEDNYAAAVAAKGLAMAQSAINSYLAFTEALASVPYPYNFIAAGTVLASGLAQQINIATTDIPSAATGGIVLPSNGGTLVNTAENGNPELLLNSGSSGAEVMGQFADQISARIGSAPSVTQANIALTLDGKTIAKKTVEIVNTGAAGQISAKRAVTK